MDGDGKGKNNTGMDKEDRSLEPIRDRGVEGELWNVFSWPPGRMVERNKGFTAIMEDVVEETAMALFLPFFCKTGSDCKGVVV